MQTPGWKFLLFGAVALALLIPACGEVAANKPDGGGGDSQGGEFTLMVDPSSLTIPIAGSADVTVTVARTGAVGDITLSASGLGSNLTASFSPEVIPDGTTTSEVTISVVGGTEAGTSTVTLTGTAGNISQSADISVTTTTITVTGKVRGNRNGVVVGLVGKQSVVSAGGGVFTFTDVTPPYDLYTVADTGCDNSKRDGVYYFDDLTRPDPTVTAGTYTASCGLIAILCTFPAPNANVSGTKSGAGNNTDAAVWAWSQGGFNSAVLNTNGTYSGNVSWCSGSTSTGSIHALQLTRKGNGAPDTFLGYAKSAERTVTNNTAFTQNLTFSAVNSAGTITGTLNGPAGYPTPTVRLNQQFESRTLSLWSTETTAIDAAFPILAAAGGTNLHATTQLAGGGTSSYVQPLTATATVDFTMPAAPVLTAPNPGDTGVTTSTMFTWTGSSGVVSRLSISTTGAVYAIFTTKTEMTIPEIPEVTLSAASSSSWSVSAFAPVSGIDDAAALDELELVSSTDYAGPAHAYAFSPNRSFTTQ